MAAHVICLTTAAGLPIFTRRKGNVDALSFPVIGSLNGVNMFTTSKELKLLNTITKDHCVVWKDFYDSITLIAVASGSTVEILNKFLESVFNVIVLIVGLDEIKLLKNVERLKYKLRIANPIIDRLLDCLDFGDPNNKYKCDLISKVEGMLCPDNHLIQIVLDSYTECVDSAFSCILINGKVAIATESWWEMHPDEIKLLSILAASDPSSTSKDILVFLPFKSPHVAYRFVVCVLIPNVQVCSLCGPTPPLQEIEHSAAQCFKATMEILEKMVEYTSSNCLESLSPDSGVLGYLLINLKKGKYVMSRNHISKKSAGSTHRLDILRTFYYQSVWPILINQSDKVTDVLEKNDSPGRPKQESKPSKTEYVIGKETYWFSEYHKCHASISEDDLICVLYTSSIPLNAMRMLSAKIMKSAVNDKQFCW